MPEPRDKEPVEEEANTEPQNQEPASKSDEDKIKDADPDAEIPSETQDKELLQRYKEQLAGTTKGFEKLAKKIDQLENKVSEKANEPPSQESNISDEDKPYIDYYKNLGFISKNDMDKEFEKRMAPLTKQQKETQKAEQQRIINKFIKDNPEFSKEDDPSGDKMEKVIDKLRRIAPAVSGNPNYSLKEDLELAKNWAFGKSDLEEFRQKAKAAGKLETFEALQTQVGGGSSVSPPKKKPYSPEQEEIMRKFGVDDKTLKNKKPQK